MSCTGTYLGIVAQMDTWVWCVRTKPHTNTVVGQEI